MKLQNTRNFVNNHVVVVEKTTKENPDFVDQPYDVKVDDQTGLIIEAEDQTFLHKDFSANIQNAFPRFIQGYDQTNWEDKTAEEINKIILAELESGEGKHWTNRSLSYMRKDVVNKRFMQNIVIPLKNILSPKNDLIFIDATANIGGVSLQWSMMPFVHKVISYDLDPTAIPLLKANIQLYKKEYKITPILSRFDYNIPRDPNYHVYVSVDVPFEIANNSSNFNFSIESKPIYFVIQDILDSGATCVFLEVPAEFRYNIRFAKDNGQFVHVYTIPSKKIKIIAISKNSKMQYKSFSLVKDCDSLDPYAAKLISTKNSNQISYYKQNRVKTVKN